MRARGLVAVTAAGILAATAIAAASSAGGPRATFISLWQPRPGRAGIVLEEFSLRDGRPLQTLARMPASPVTASRPHALPGGAILVTLSTGPRYRNGTAGGDPAPDSCSSRVVRIDPARGRRVTLLSFPSSTLVTEAVPSPDGRELAMLAGPCARSFFNQHLLGVDLRTGRRWTIGAGAAPCHALSSPSWSPDGSALVFAYGPAAPAAAGGPLASDLGRGLCSANRPGELAIVAAGRSAGLGGLSLIAPEGGCNYESAAFDRRGVVAFEACAEGALSLPGGAVQPPGTFFGRSSLVQLDARRRVVLRLPLPVGANPGTVAASRGGALVLVGEDQGQSLAHPARDRVWEFDGRRLRAVASYPFDGDAVVTPEPR